GLGSVGARVERGLDLRPVAMKPWLELVGPHPVDARGTGVLLDPPERRRQVLAGEELLPEPPGGDGVRRGLAGRREAALLFAGASGFTLGTHCAKAPPGRGWLLRLPRARASFASASRSALHGARSRRYYGLF